MSAFFQFLPLMLVVVIYTLCVKVAAKAYRRSRLGWRSALGFAALVLVVGGLGVALTRPSGAGLGQWAFSLVLLAVQVAVGGWYLGTRMATASGAPVAFRGGVIVAAMAHGIALTLALVMAAAVPVLFPGVVPG